MPEMSHSKTLVVAAIDFGTTYSGYAFSFSDRPFNVRTNQVWSSRLVSYKTPTCLLLDPKGRFHSFGYEAETNYAELWDEGIIEGWALFRRFKMALYNDPDLEGKTMVEDISHKVKKPIRTIFALSIKYLKDHLLTTLKRNDHSNMSIKEDDVFFVITVPAIWTDRAKQLMREAAMEAEIEGTNLTVALESEAASIWCQTIPHTISGKEFSIAEVGTKYMVVDLGGGTADITVHQTMRDGKIHELEAASGGDWGGTRVDQYYIHMLTSVMGKEVMTKFGTEYIGDLFDMLREFETTKRTISSKSKGVISFKIPASLRELYESREEKDEPVVDFTLSIKGSKYGDKIRVKGDKFRVDVDLARDMFTYPIMSLCGQIDELLHKPKLNDISAIIMVGGFSDCPLVQEAISENFGDRKLIYPHESGLVVLKGAVLYGHRPGVVATRIARFTYGIRSNVDFDPDVHPEDSKKMYSGVAKCPSAFRKYVEVGQEIATGYTVKEKGFPASDEQTQLTYDIYISSKPDPVLVTDVSCSLLGSFTIPLPRGDTKEDRGFEKAIVFGDTELMFRVKHDTTGEMFTKYFNFM